MRDIVKQAREEYLVLDGAMGTELITRGISTDQLPEEWNVSSPDLVRDVHFSYLEAGAQIVETNTFGGSSVKLGLKGKERMMEDLNARGAGLAVEARRLFEDQNPDAGIRYVAGSIGPLGRMLGMDLTKDDALSAFSSQGEVLAANGVDLFIVETMMDLNEAAAALKALKKESGLPVFVSLVFNRTKKDELRTLFGNGVEESVKRLLDCGADAVGANCGLLDDYIQVAAEMRSLTTGPVVIYPNAGTPRIEGDRTVFDTTALDLIACLEREIEAGATIIGGCCGTTPEYTRLLSERIGGRKRGS
ncbi:MAG: homocysteine S-methyltransferase family protein [Spirochaetes bacterium]|nr:homocysteine S-methyltransferase family protein [Spirochaetota bacterium]